MTSWSVPPPELGSPAGPAAQKAELLAVRWEAALGVALVSHPQGLVLATSEEVSRWRVEVFEKLGALERQRGGRFPIVVCVDNLTIRPGCAEEYGKVVRAYAGRFATGLARYTQRPNGVGQMITVAAMKEGFRANIFSTRREAVAQALAGRDSSTGKPRSSS